MEGQASISSDILSRYAADAAAEVAGVSGVVERHLPPHKGVRISEGDGGVTVEVHLGVEWGASIPDVGRAVQARVREYLAQMADLETAAVNVVVDEIGTPA
jgi:uncharacterized alkaline shock family protein YloU